MWQTGRRVNPGSQRAPSEAGRQADRRPEVTRSERGCWRCGTRAGPWRLWLGSLSYRQHGASAGSGAGRGNDGGAWSSGGRELGDRRTHQGLAIAAWGIQAQGTTDPKSREGVRGGDMVSWEDPAAGPARFPPGPQTAQAHPPLPSSGPASHPQWQREQGRGPLDHWPDGDRVGEAGFCLLAV